ncbi:PLxRFG domain-containing protein [Ensifer sp. NBAIM29]|nr:PLxRFG domain-containing protein [Ensifer sp. NBAIM29]
MPIVIGLDSDVEWSNPLNLSSGAKSGFGLDGTSSEAKSAPSSRDWNDIVDTVIAEAAGEGDEGMAAVASVIKNRAGARGKTPAEIIREPDQFTGYSKPGDAAKRAMQDPEMRRRAEAVVASVFSGEVPDPTGGADHYHATSVSPDWASKMPRTTRVGNHLFYNSKRDRARPESETSAIGFTGEPPRSEAESAFDAVLADEPESTTRVPNPEGKGLARLVRPQPDAPAGDGGALSFVHKGQDKIDPAFSAILVDTSKSMGRNFTITSGYRSPKHPVEARKQKPGEHSHGTAVDISMRGMDDAQRARLVTELRARGVRRFGTYTNEPDMLHVDMKDQVGDGTTWFMHDTTNRRLAKAPEWFQELSRQPSPSSAGSAKESGGIVIDENFTSDNPGLMAQAKELREARLQREAEAKAAAEQERIGAGITADNQAVAAHEQALKADRGNRYQVIDESELPAWKQKWEEENRSSGVLGDTGRILKSGAIGVGQSISSMADTLFNNIPGGETFLEASDAIDRWAMGETLDSKMGTAQDLANASVTPEQQAADAKKWWDGENGGFGPAWRDPRSYLRGVGESAPGTVVTMLPGGILARGKYMSMIASGVEQRVAAASAAKVATVAGAVSEGLLGGADSARHVRQRIAQIPREQLAQSEAVRILVDGGMSEADAIKAVSEDAATQAFLVSGVATGMFGGMGDRALAKIVAEGVGGNVVKRILAGTARGAVAEGVFEELPQGMAQTVAQNAAVRNVDPSQSLTEGIEEAAAAGLATGGAMGGGMGAAGGAASRRQPAPPVPSVDPAPRPSGPLGRAVAHGQSRAEERAVSTLPDVTAEPAAAATPPADGRPEVGATVRIDEDGIEPILGSVQGYEGDEAIVVDGGTGEVYQVPIGNLTKTGDSVEKQAAALREKQAEPPLRDVMPEESSDEALRPLEPRAAETTTEVPPAREQKPATEMRPTRPKPGGRVIVEGENGERFPARIERYEEDGAEAVVIDDNGKPYQVPVEQLSVSGLTPAQVEKQELERNPPIEREPADAGPNSRRIGERTVVLPDEKHAHLYDLAMAQIIAKKLGGTSQVDMGSFMPAERKRLADEFGVSPDDLVSMADDYRYRVQRAAKEAKSALPVKMHSVNERLLKQRQAAHAKNAPEAVAAKDEAGQWWDVELTAQARKRVLEQAGVKRNERVMWGNLTPNIQQKLIAVRDAERGTAERDSAPVSTFKTAKGSVYQVHADGTTTRDKAARNDPGHEGDSGRKPRTAKTVYVETNAGALSAAGLQGLGAKGARVAIKNGKATLVTWNNAGNGWGASEGSRDIPIHAEPAVGRYPLELWDKADDVPGYEAYSRMHAGNKITELGAPAKDPSAVPGQRTDEDDMEARAAEWKSRHTVEFIHKEMAKRVSPADFARRASTKEQIAAVIEPGGKLLVLNSTSNPNGDHAEFFGTLAEAGHMADPNPYIRVTSYGNHIGASTNGPISDAAAATLQAVRTAATREGITVLSDAPASVDDAANEAATSPTNDLPEPSQAQKEAGNYKVGRIRLGGLDISIENPAGSARKGTSPSGKPWSITMKSHYGYIRGTVGRDKDHIDIFVKPGTEALGDSSPIFVVDQRDPARGRFDEHKVMAGYGSEEEARAAYLENYTSGWKGLGAISPTTLGEFKAWLESGKTEEPFAPKWFGSRDKAEAHVAKEKLGATHEVVENGKRFEIREKKKKGEAPNPAQEASTREPTPEPKPKAEKPKPAPKVRSGERRTLHRGASAEEIASIKEGTFEFRNDQTGIMFTTDAGTAEYFGQFNRGGMLTATIPADAKTFNRGQIKDSTPEWYRMREEAFKRYGAENDPAAAIRAELLDRGYEVVTYKSGNGQYDVYEVLDPSIIEVQEKPAPAEKAKPDVSENKVFTESAADKARALLRRKLFGSTLNSGIDPEIVQAGITLAGYHIEKGARTFVAYAKAMLADLGEDVRPYLKSWYMGVKYDPRAAQFDGMSSAAEVEETDVADIAVDEGSASDEPAELDQSGSRALEGAPSEPVSRVEAGRASRNGTERGRGADVSRSEPARRERVSGGRGVADGQGDLLAAAGRGQEGGEEQRNRRQPDAGRQERDENGRDQVTEGPFGPILRSYEGKWREAALELERRQAGDAIGALRHAEVGSIDLVWGNAGTNQHNGAGLAKLLAWHPEVLRDLQGFIDGLHVDRNTSTPRRIQLVNKSGRAGIRLDYDGTAKTWLLTAYSTDTDRRTTASKQSLRDLWGEVSAGSGASPDTATIGSSDANASRRTGTTENISDTLRDVQSAATPAQQRPTDYVITEDDNLGEGGQKAKFRGNVAAIRLLRKLDEEKRPATRDEQSVLAKWVGWGGLRNAFYREDGSVSKGWEKEAKELKELLDSAEYASAESSTRNAHYTSPEIVNAAWDIAHRLGFKGGQVLEPSVGAGNFLGLMPGEMRDGARITGVELDRITGGIAKNLYPGANIQTPIGFEKLTLPNDYFDLAIGNPPFGSERLYDKERRHLNKLSIHNFFFAKSIETLRPGGVLAMVVTNRFLDGSNAAAREHIAKTADLVGAIRLPNNAFLKNAGTEVTTDIVILRKRLEGDKPDTSWTNVGEWKGKDGKAVPLNQYFIDKPDMMLGDFGAYGTMYGPDDPALIARDGDDLPALLAKAIRTLPENVMVEPGAAVAPETVTVPEGVSDVQVGAMFASSDGSVHIRMPDHLGQPVSEAVSFPNDTAKERVAGMVRVRDAFAKLRRAQIDEKASDQQIENLRKRLNTLYDGFVKKHGPINADANKRLFRDDPTWPQISALEQNFDKGISATVAQRTGEKAKPASAEKAAIFFKRTQQPYRRPTSASSAKDALATVLNDFGRVNLDAMSVLYGKPVEAIVEELGPLLYKTPAGNYETSDHYLSGNIKKKLAEAERAAESDPDFRRNVAALRDVQPADIEAVDIDVKAGAPWIPAKHIADFITHITESKVPPRAFYSRANAKWDIDAPSPSASAATLWGTDRAGVGTILSAVLNGQSITISDRMSDGTTVVNQAATDAANEKAERVKAEWRKWLWENDARRDELVRIYNDTFNTDVLRSYDGSHLSLPGKVGDDIIEMRPHQKSFIWRTLQSGTALADHTVGAGKTFAAISSAMEKRRIGQARKPMFVVPNHLVGQWGADFVKLYPGAKVLATTEKDFEKENRKRLFARIATGDWDAVIVAHSSFGRIGIDPEYEARFIQTQMDDLEDSITSLRRATGEKSRNVAQLTKWRDNLKAKMERLLDAGKKDDGLTFDELGVDALYVDEAHEFKNLAFSTSMQRVAGLGNNAGSQKASDLFMKSRFILERTKGNNVVFLTGTPLSNTMAEMFTVQRYLDEPMLRDLGISHFDAWAKVFGEVVTDWELSPSGQYKLNSRFAKFVNVPELMQHYLSFADVITNDDIKAQLAAIGKKLPLPKVRGGKPTNITVERSPDQAAYIGEGKADEVGNLVFPKGSIVWRAENLPKKVEKGADNMLKVMSDARKAALDMRLIDAGYGDYQGSKVHRAADEMMRIYKQWEAKRGIQLVFIDLSTPKKAKAAEEARLRELMQKAEEGDEKAQETLDNMSPDEFLALQSPFSVYDDLRQKLIDRGVPAAEIAFIHDANTQAQKEELFGKVRSGRVRFLFGSTPKMGAGTNVQNRLVALHHIDAPWRPSDLEQRDGRGIRQGNELYADDPEGFEIEILRYATKNTLDARTWQTIEAKARFIQQVRKGNLKTREIEDIAGEAANAAEMKAAASGNPLILEEMETRRRVRQLESQAVEHDREQHRIKSRVRHLTDEAEALRNRQPAVEADAARAAAAEKAAFAGVVKGETFDKPKEFGAAVIAAIRREMIEKEGVTEIGEYAGFKIAIEHLHSREFDIALTGARDYHVHVEDAADMDPTGTAMRITNTLKRLANVPAVDRERLADIEKQVPALEKQIGPWEGTKELEETSARHRRLVEALRPKPKGKEPTVEVTGDGAAAPDAPRENKRPDPTVAGADGRLQSAGTPSLNRDIPLRDAAIERVLDDGRRTGHEYLLAIDDDGSVVEYGTAGDAKSTGMSNRLLSAMSNPDRKLVFFHNHPSGGPVSRDDIAYLAFPGLHSIWAAGHAGRFTRASLTEAAGNVLDRATVADIHRSQQLLIDAAKLIQEEIRSFLQDKVNDKVITPAQATELHSNTWLMVFDRANIIDFTTNAPYDTASVSDLDSMIDAAAVRLAGEFFNDPKATIRRSGRRAQPLGHLAELARTPVVRAENAAGGRVQTGPAEGSAPDYQREARGGEKGRRVTEARVVEDLRGKLTDLQPALLKTIPLNYFSELARSNMTAVGEYMRVKRLMDAFRGKKHAEADAIAQDWLKYTRLGYLGKDKAKAAELAELMHDTTLAGIDPSNTDKETREKGGYDALRKRYVALSPKGKELYAKVRDAYADQQLELDEILLDNVRKAQEIALRQAEDRYKRTLQRIKDAGLTGIDRRNAEEDAASAYKAETTKARWAAKARMTKMRIAFENSRVEEPYFPLGRFGRYFVTVRDIDGKVLSFSKFERAADRDRAVRELRREFPNGKVEAGVMEQGSDLRRAMDPRIVAEIEEILGGAGVGAEIMDQIWQRYLESMPDLSNRKRFIHRKGTAGFTADALRVFSSHMFHAAHQMARLKYGLELQELVDQTFDQAKEADDPTRAVTLANELSNRHEWVMNPTGGKVAQTMTSVAFVWFLAGSVSAAMVNMTQTIMLGLPILGARFGGITKAGAAIASASADSVRGRGSVVDGNLTADEKKAMEAFYESGLIDRTQSHDLAGVGETGVEYTPLRAKVMGVISWMFHRAEVWNREVTALAAYRLARGAGQSVSEAIDTAHDMTWKTHFDYSNSSRPALMQNDFAKVALVFRQHNINMLYRLFRDVHQSFKGETPAARREARYQLAGITGMMALMAGVTGTVGFNLLMGIASLIFGDDDDPMDFEQKFRANVVDILGPELGGIVLNGVPGHYLGVDLSARIGMPDLWFRSPTRELQGKDEFQYWLSQTLGATAGLGEQLYTGFRVITDEGDVARGLEMMSPKPIRDLLKAYRYADEGVTTIGGDEVLPADAVGVHDVVAQALGFTPARVSETYERNSALKNAESRVRQKRQRLINRWAMAALMKDKEAAREAIDDIKRFNAVKVNAGVAITKETLQRSIKMRVKNAAKREDGVLIQNEALGKDLRELLAESIYR